MAVTYQDIELPFEFSGEAQFILYTRYGDPREPGWHNKWINSWNVAEKFPWFPVAHIHIHKHFQPLVEAAFAELEMLNLHTEINTFDGCFEIRNIKSSPVLSLHCWGAALDLNEAGNPLGSNGKWSDDFLNVMEKHNIFCGQRWTGRKDPMHFSMLNG